MKKKKWIKEKGEKRLPGKVKKGARSLGKKRKKAKGLVGGGTWVNASTQWTRHHGGKRNKPRVSPSRTASYRGWGGSPKD